ncbi:E3 SUMO-protein ligase NSE2-like [Macrosteles quadrilineatus]|uniref:E3 SUMO-protein ligase NSE2-like n=1 Tax=Macrosteles quadrilineatus TaxID=74068 RepID=UPI0023E2F91C|nr:E3 SUMO-protein ligase NSE2-like [Macrosteles quadrilineatus]
MAGKDVPKFSGLGGGLKSQDKTQVKQSRQARARRLEEESGGLHFTSGAQLERATEPSWPSIMTDSTENERSAMFVDAVRSLEKCTELVIKQLEGEERKAQIKELKTVMLEYCDLDNNWKLEKKMLSEIDRSLAEENNINKIDEAYANVRKIQSDADPHKHQWYLNLERKIKQWLARDDPDIDIVDTGSTESFLDPFTKLMMKDPVKNTLCSHSYEKESVLTMLKAKKEIRCPVVGCAYKGFFNQHHLEPNREMLRQLKNSENK